MNIEREQIVLTQHLTSTQTIGWLHQPQLNPQLTDHLGGD